MHSGSKVIIAHRGASIAHAENTLASFEAGYVGGANLIETDVVLTRDGVAICLHDLWLDTTTDAADVFPDRARDDGRRYAADFDLAEILKLTARGRDTGPKGDGAVPTFAEYLELIARLNDEGGRRVEGAGVIVEPKDPGFHIAEGRRVEDEIMKVAGERGWLDGRMIIQSFSVDSLMYVKSLADVPLFALTKEGFDADELDRLKGQVVGVGPERSVAEREDAALVNAAHERDLVVYPYTFRDEPSEMRRFLFEIGVDGLFTDDPAGGVEIARG